MTYIFPALAGFATGILSSWGIGGGSLLVVYMTVFAGITQQAAQGANLLYFLPTSMTALWSHLRNQLVEVQLAIPAIIAGILTASGAAFIASTLDTAILRKIFGVFILIIGVSEVFHKSGKKGNAHHKP